MPGWWRTRNREKDRRATSLLARLRCDTRGNVLAMVGAALIPLTAMVGGAVDISRAYLAKGRMQQACDAASLAGRRVMSDDEMSNAVREEADRYFNFNFEQGSYQVAPFDIDVTRPETGTIRVAAQTTIPTAVMYIFGYDTLPLSVTCEASQNFINTDVMLVLDTTGSMAERDVGKGTRMAALQEAVMALYDQLEPIQEELETNGMRLRYGAVPYSMNANVGRLIHEVNSDFIRTNGSYWQRPCYVEGFGRVEKRMCEDRSYFYEECRDLKYSRDECIYARDNLRSWGNTGFYPLDVSSYVASSKWSGCIEERSTTSDIDGNSGLDVPAAATDLNIGLLPHNDETRWQPSNLAFHDALPQNLQAVCPSPAKRMGVMTKTQMKNFVEDLNPNGGTYHDIGMMWGTRMISRTGVFAADNPDDFNGMPVNRHIIFMTDGLMDNNAMNPNVYSIYGVEREFGRITGKSNPRTSHMLPRHHKRFAIMCNEARREGINIWVVSFSPGSSVSDEMRNCASNPAQAVHASNRNDLIEKFVAIGRQIGSLRLTE